MDEKDQKQAEAAQPDSAAAEATTADAAEGTEQGALVEQLETAQAEVEEYRNRWQRSVADFENLRRRTQKDKEEALTYGNQKLILALLPTLDNLERALHAAESGSLKDGVDLVARQFRETLQRQGLQPIEALNQPFDPNLHEAVMQEEGGDYSEPTVVQELQKGYKLHDRVIRPSMVKVARP